MGWLGKEETGCSVLGYSEVQASGGKNSETSDSVKLQGFEQQTVAKPTIV